MYEVSVKIRFSAAHHLTGYPGACALPHGHNWDVEVFLAGGTLNATGILIDFRRIRETLRDAVKELDHTDLNTVAEFKERNPTSENLARYLYCKMAACIGNSGVRVSRVSVYETPESRATYWEP